MTDEELCKRLRGWGMKTPSAGAARIEELTEQLKTVLDREAATTARYDAKLETLTEQLNTCRMAQVVMENGIAEAEKERDEALNQLDSARHSVDVLEKRVAFVEEERRKTFQALLKVTKIHDEVEAKLAKAVEAADRMLDAFCVHETQQQVEAYDIMCATLAEIEGSDAP